MGILFLIPRKYIILFLIISASLISTSAAGRRSKFLKNNTDEQLGGAYYEESSLEADEREEITVHERMLRMNTHDYGRYDPSPRLHKPRYKLIPN